MKKLWIGILVAPLLVSHAVWAADSGQAVGDSVQAGKKAAESGGRPVQVIKKANSARGSAQSVSNAMGSTGRVISGTSAIPLSVGAVVLSAGATMSAGAAQGSTQTVAAPIGTPLAITSETITVMPPNQALQKKPDTQLEGKPDK
ncbi:MAG: hypothetical protein PHI11_10965 [Gallionella sp.]|nr:hypothetical protein [Gallionella sp.]